VQFQLNQQLLKPAPAETDMTLLHYLRSCGLTGTKEGCASGDCGACTVLVGRDSPEGWVYQAVNACICPLGSLDKCQVITVEGLAQNNTLHPVQEALIECHASQCGFCTPGFVMALAALQQQPPAPLTDARAAVIEAISGNLCRCTGYKPIIAAGLAALKKPVQLANKVQEWLPNAPSLGNTQFADAEHFYCQPLTEADLQALLLRHPHARLVAGGTDLMLELTQQYHRLPQLIDISRIPALRQIVQSGDCLVLGAALTYSELERELALSAPEFVQLLKRLGSRQIRNRGTLGGNIANASPIADGPPWLLVLDAQLELVNSAGRARRLPLAEFYQGYKQTALQTGEYIARIQLPRAALARVQRLYKVSKRVEDDISAVLGAFSFDGQQLRIAYGGMAAIPRRASATEALLNQALWLTPTGVDESLLVRAQEQLRAEFAPLADVRASADYRLALACNLLARACREFAGQILGQEPAPNVYELGALAYTPLVGGAV